MQRIPSTIPCESLDIFQILHMFVCESSSTNVCCRLTFLRAEATNLLYTTAKLDRNTDIRIRIRMAQIKPGQVNSSWQLLVRICQHADCCRSFQPSYQAVSAASTLITTATVHFKDVKSDGHTELKPPPDYELCEPRYADAAT